MIQKSIDGINDILNNGSLSDAQVNEKQDLESQLEQYYDTKSKGFQVRSRSKWVEEGEKGSRYFLRLENKMQSENVIKKVKNKNGTFIKDKDILEQCTDFYSKLYTSSKPNLNDIDEYLNELQQHNTINENEKNLCDRNISVKEVTKAVESLNRNKSPGLDGLTPEFYKHFWSKLKLHFMNMINESFELGQLPDSLKKSVLALLFKKGETTALGNHRPISLSNYDYKIIAFVLAKRLQEVIGKLVNKDQSAYIKGRYIGYNARMILDMIEYCENTGKEGILLGLDFKKAFDSLEWDFMYATLRKFNFGEKFIKWIKIFYFEPSLIIKNNGWLSQEVKIGRGIRQGCPISALLFILCVEMMYVAIKQNENIKGITISNEEIKSSQYADDTTLILNNKDSVKPALRELKRFSVVAGLELNIEKTVGLWLGKYKDDNIKKFEGITFPDEPSKILGVYIGQDKVACDIKNWEPKLNQIEKLTESWKTRKLTLLGKVTVINSILVSKLVYNFTILEVKDEIISRLNKIIFNFLWNKKDRIKRKTIIRKIENGGLGLVDIKLKIEALKASWAQRILTCNNSWALLPKKYISETSLPTEIFIQTNFGSLPKNIAFPPFYKTVFEAYNKCKTMNKEINGSDILKEPIWLNKRFLTKGNVLYYKHWIKKGFILVKDFFHRNGSMIDENEIIQKLGENTNNWMIEYLSIKTIILGIIKQNRDIPQMAKYGTKKKNQRFFMNNEYHNYYEIIKPKVFYQALVSKESIKNKNECFWKRTFNINIIDWKQVYKQKIKHVPYVKLAEFNYKILNDILPCGKIVYHWNRNISKYCGKCNVIQDSKHMLFDCKLFKPIWDKIRTILKLNISWKHIVIGFDLYDSSSNVNRARNFVLTNIAFIIFSLYSKYAEDMAQLNNINLQTAFKAKLASYLQTYKNTKIISKITCNMFEHIISDL